MSSYDSLTPPPPPFFFLNSEICQGGLGLITILEDESKVYTSR